MSYSWENTHKLPSLQALSLAYSFDKFIVVKLFCEVVLFMAEIEKTVSVEYSTNQMFALVDAVEDYPKFLPWCGGASVDIQDDQVIHATVKINYYHVKHSFTTENTRQPPNLIQMRLLDGPFKHLDGHWRFISLSDNVCKIEFHLHYTFSNRLLEKIFGPIFYMIANSFVESFIERADATYGKT